MGPFVCLCDAVRPLSHAQPQRTAHYTLLVARQVALLVVRFVADKATAHLNIQWSSENPGAQQMRYTTPIFMVCVTQIQTSMMSNLTSLGFVYGGILLNGGMSVNPTASG